MIPRIIILTICGLIALSLPLAHAEEVTFATAPLTIATRDIRSIPFTVEVAANEKQREQGLMFRGSVPDKHGMIFDFGKPQHIDMWMKNTLVPLDMIFIDSQGIITQIAERTTPESTAIITSGRDARLVLEVAGGTAARYHIAKGDKVVYSGLNQQDKVIK